MSGLRVKGNHNTQDRLVGLSSAIGELMVVTGVALREGLVGEVKRKFEEKLAEAIFWEDYILEKDVNRRGVIDRTLAVEQEIIGDRGDG